MARSLTVVRSEPTRKEKREAAETLQESSQVFLECRDLRHPWKVVGLFYVGKEIHRRLVCTRCETEATDRWTPYGGRIARQYRYAKGYQAKGVRIRPVDVRKEVLNRVDVYATEDDMMMDLVSGGRRRKRA